MTAIKANRQIVLDTETTGMNKFSPHYEGHCIIEIGAVELINRRYSGNNFHVYIKPNRLVDPEAVKVHGITDEMLADKPKFSAIAEDFIHYIRGAELLIHNAPFDVGFMDYEFSKLNLGVKTAQICTITDTLQMARLAYPGKRNNLDALCARLNIDNSKRTLHGALLDAEILADVYLTMTGGQTNLFDDEENLNLEQQANSILVQQPILKSVTGEENFTQIQPSAEELQAHLALLELINKKSNGHCAWLKLMDK